MAFNKKCTCAVKTGNMWCRYCSRIKAGIMLKTGNNHLKIPDKDGILRCPYWYCAYSKNGKSDQKIKDTMEIAIEKSKYAGLYNKIDFYENFTKTKLLI
jgi:hypothetical protein